MSLFFIALYLLIVVIIIKMNYIYNNVCNKFIILIIFIIYLLLCCLFMNYNITNIIRSKRTKYAHLEESHYFVPVAVETMRVFGPEARSFLRELGHRIANATQDALSHLYLRQRISVAVQRGNTAAILGPTVGSDYLGDFSSH